MSTEPLVHKETPVQSAINPFARALAGHVNAGTVAIESERAIAEAQGKLVIAKRFPRDQARAYANIIDACKRPGLAEEACYSFPRGGKSVSGPSIRLTEMLAANWGNVDYGLRELSRKDGVSEMEAYCWDLETNTMSSQKFTVRHIRDKTGGNVALTDERDIYELTANMGARRLRARILAILPADLAQAAVDECTKTLAGNNELPIADRIRSAVSAFKNYGVTADMLEKHLGHGLDSVLPDELAELRKIHISIRDGISNARDWFGGEGEKIDGDPDIEQPNKRPEPKARATKGAAGAKQEQPKSEPLPPAEQSKTEPAKPDDIQQAMQAREAKTVAAEKPADKPAEPAKAAPVADAAPVSRAFLNEGERYVTTAKVDDFKAIAASVDGQNCAAIRAILSGGYVGEVRQKEGGAKFVNNNTEVVALPPWQVGAVLKFTLFGKKASNGKVIPWCEKVETLGSEPENLD